MHTSPTKMRYHGPDPEEYGDVDYLAALHAIESGQWPARAYTREDWDESYVPARSGRVGS